MHHVCAQQVYPVDQYMAPLERTILVAALVPTRSAREVAIRIRWMSSQQRSQPKDSSKRKITNAASSGQLTRPPLLGASVAGAAATNTRLGLRSRSFKLPVTTTTSSTEPTAIPPQLAAPLFPSLSASSLDESPSPQPTNSNSSDDAYVNIRPATDSASPSLPSDDPAAGPSTCQEPLPLSNVQTLIQQVCDLCGVSVRQCAVR